MLTGTRASPDKVEQTGRVLKLDKKKLGLGVRWPTGSGESQELAR